MNFILHSKPTADLDKFLTNYFVIAILFP